MSSLSAVCPKSLPELSRQGLAPLGSVSMQEQAHLLTATNFCRELCVSCRLMSHICAAPALEETSQGNKDQLLYRSVPLRRIPVMCKFIGNIKVASGACAYNRRRENTAIHDKLGETEPRACQAMHSLYRHCTAATQHLIQDGMVSGVAEAKAVSRMLVPNGLRSDLQ